MSSIEYNGPGVRDNVNSQSKSEGLRTVSNVDKMGHTPQML